MLSPLLANLKDLVNYCELIAFTILPRAFVDQLYAKVPELRTIFSYTFCNEDLISTNQYLIKDLGYILNDRSIGDIIVIDFDESRIDNDYFSSIIL